MARALIVRRGVGSPRRQVSLEPVRRRGWARATVLMAIVVALPAPSAAANSFPAEERCEPAWVHEFGGESGVDTSWLYSQAQSYVMRRFDDGSGERLFLGGAFDLAGGGACTGLAVFDGGRWQTVGGGLVSSPPNLVAVVHDLVVYDDGSGPALFVAGSFSGAGGLTVANIAKWDGAEWSDVGGGVDGGIATLCVFDDGTGPALYAGGPFKNAGGAPASRVARWNGRSWSAVGTSINSLVKTLAVHDDGSGPALYAGGVFTLVDGITAHHVARWNGVAWSAVGAGLEGSTQFINVWKLIPTTDSIGETPRLVACGDFTHSGAASLKSLAQWDGTSWSPIAETDGTVYALLERPRASGVGHELVVGGQYQTIGGVPAEGLAVWDGTQWSEIGGGIVGGVVGLDELGVWGDSPRSLGVTGGILMAGQIGVSNVTIWDDTEWHSLGDGLSGGGAGANVYDVEVVEDEQGAPSIVVGGTIHMASGTPVHGTARWDGSTWSPMGEGLGGPSSGASALIVSVIEGAPTLYAGGSFTKSGIAPVQRLAKWTGSEWVEAGGGANGSVLAMIEIEDGAGRALVVAGSFTSIGGIAANRIARWDGVQWSALGSGMNDLVDDVIMFDDGSGPALYAAGEFTQAGGAPANRVAKWNGASWIALGSGCNQAVRCLAVFDDGFGPALFAGGYFSQANGQAAKYIARWDGNTWSACGSGANGPIFALAPFDPGDGAGERLYVGGSFSSAGGVAGTSFFACWNGAVWSDAGASIGGGNVSMIRPLGGRDDPARSLLVGGAFTGSAAGDSHLTRLVACPLPCEADLTGDGLIDGADIAALLSEWGSPRKGRASADLNHDGIVNGADLSLVLGGWGACP